MTDEFPYKEWYRENQNLRAAIERLTEREMEAIAELEAVIEGQRDENAGLRAALKYCSEHSHVPAMIENKVRAILEVQYAGMSYEQASREGARLIAKANESGNWFAILDQLIELRAIMQRLGITT